MKRVKSTTQDRHTDEEKETKERINRVKGGEKGFTITRRK